MTIDSSRRPTVGRELELGRLDAALEALDGGAPAFLTFEGEPGIGKSRLMRELELRADARGHLVLMASAAEFERSAPFSVWADALDGYVLARDLDLPDADDLAEILPSLRRPGSQVSAVADERYRAHRAMRGLLDVLATERPLVLGLDDAHWSDPASIDLIAALLRRAPQTPVLIALAFRPGQAPASLVAALATPAAQRSVLEPLSESDAASLLGNDDAGEIYARAGGNPFYLEQLARVTPRDGGSEHAAGGIPAAVAASLAEELGALGERELTFLRGAAVAGEPFEPDIASAIGELQLDAGIAALDALLARDLLRATSAPRRFRFRHPLVRRAVYDATPAGWRLGGHRRAAAVLEQRGAAPAEIAHHVERCAGQGDRDAIAVLVAAGEATAPRAPAAAARWFEAALRLLPAADVDRQVELRVALAGAQRSLDLVRCRETLLAAMDLLEPDASSRRVELTALCAGVEHWLGLHEEAHRRLTRAWDELEDRSSAVGATLQIELAVDGLYVLDVDQAVNSGVGALDVARDLGDRPLIAAAASAVCLAEAAAGHIEAARTHRTEALAEIDRLSDAELAPRLEALFHLGWAENYLEHWDDAVAHIDRGIAIARATGEGRLLVPMMLVKGYPFEFGGRLAEALEVSEAAVEASRLSGNDHYLFWSLFELGWAHYHAGRLDEAIAAGEESARVGGRLAGGTMPASGGGPGWQLGCARFEAGQVEEAWEIMHALGSDDLEHKIPIERCIDWEILALVELALGRHDTADGYVRRAEQLAAELPLNLPTAFALRGRAAVLLATGEPLDAAAKAAAAAAAADAAGARLVAAFARGLAGQALAAAGKRKEAVAALRTAESELDICGCVRVRDELRRELRKLGARAETRGPATSADSGIAALTKRELEIAELVTDRRTNREIAALLFLSDKTIESHLRNIFVKLGVSSRVDVARAVEREREAA